MLLPLSILGRVPLQYVEIHSGPATTYSRHYHYTKPGRAVQNRQSLAQHSRNIITFGGCI